MIPWWLSNPSIFVSSAPVLAITLCDCQAYSGACLGCSGALATALFGSLSYFGVTAVVALAATLCGSLSCSSVAADATPSCYCTMGKRNGSGFFGFLVEGL